jgi:hypothetical protein
MTGTFSINLDTSAKIIADLELEFLTIEYDDFSIDISVDYDSINQLLRISKAALRLHKSLIKRYKKTLKTASTIVSSEISASEISTLPSGDFGSIYQPKQKRKSLPRQMRHK